ncbi:MAG: DUF3604 domain-containing protein [Litorilinea sp.]
MEQLSERLGTVSLQPHVPVVAGSMGQWTLTLTVGSYGIDEGGTIKLAQRFAADWEVPQFDRPDASGYTTVTTNGAARLRPYYHTKAHERPWMKCLVIDVYDGSLASGDVVTIVLGDRSQGAPGIRAQTFQESAHEFRILVDPTNASRALPLPTSPKFPVVAGSPVALVCLLPSEAEVGAPTPIFVKGEDQWGNPTPAPADLAFSWKPLADEAASAVQIAAGQCVAYAPALGRVQVEAQTERGLLRAASNPVNFVAAPSATQSSAPPALRHWWGDLHAQSAGTVGTGDEDEYFRFGRDVARLDFASHQGNDFQIDDAYWQHLNETVRKFHRDGEFVVFPGYEWSANTPAGGDRNVFFRREGLPIMRSSHWQIPHVAEDVYSPAHPADELFRRVREHVAPEDVLLGAHVGGRYADIRRYFDAELGPLVEVVSCWGVFEWMLADAFAGGHVVGVMCNSDGHKGRPGAEGPGAGEFGIRGGLTCVLAAEKTRAAIWDALAARHCYGTSGARILVEWGAQVPTQTPAGASYLMGDVVPGAVDSLHVAATVTGCGPLESLTLYAGMTPIKTVRAAAFGSTEGQTEGQTVGQDAASISSRRVRVLWQGSRMRGRGRRVTWDGEVRVVGAKLTAAQPVAFDSYSDGIVAQDDAHVRFRSATTGDLDGLDLWLDAPSAGRLIFTSTAGTAEFDLTELARVGAGKTVDFGGLDMALTVQRYPESVTDLRLELTQTVRPPADTRTPYWVKAVQVDGQMAWASPIYVTGTAETKNPANTFAPLFIRE